MLVIHKQYLLFQSLCYVLLGTIFVYRNTLQGIGKSTVSMFAGVTEVAGRVIASLLFVSLWGFTGICLSNSTAWLAADLFLVITYFVVMRGKGKRAKCSRRKKEKGGELASDVS